MSNQALVVDAAIRALIDSAKQPIVEPEKVEQYIRTIWSWVRENIPYDANASSIYSYEQQVSDISGTTRSKKSGPASANIGHYLLSRIGEFQFSIWDTEQVYNSRFKFVPKYELAFNAANEDEMLDFYVWEQMLRIPWIKANYFIIRMRYFIHRSTAVRSWSLHWTKFS